MQPPAPADARRIVLASASPRRQLLLQILGIPHDIRTAEINEREISFRSPREYALKTAFAKACAMDAHLPKDTIVVAADTIVVLENEVLLKPTDETDAFNILRKISGKTHEVITAVAVREIGRATQLDSVSAKVQIRNASDDEIRDYIATGEPMDKAGAYGIQGMGGRLVERVTGDYFTVVGLPVDKTLQMLSTHIDIAPYQAARRALTPESFAARS